MASYPYQIKILIQRLLICYFVYFLCRFIFFVANASAFSSVTWVSFIADCFWGLRFDTFSIFVSNSLFILLSILPIRIFFSNGYQKFLKGIFIFFNAVFILPNCVDFGYFAYSKKRSGADLFNQVGGQTDIGKLLPQYIKDFWWILLIYILLIVLIVWLYSKIKIKTETSSQVITLKRKIFVPSVALFIPGLVLLGIRGGFQRVPVDIVDAGGMVAPEEVPIILNTPFTLIKSLDKESLVEYNFYDEKTLKEKFNPVHHFSDLEFKKQNVVVLILESFAKEYTQLGRTISYTPFLDSLMRHGLVFTNGYANGTKSIEGIPAILSALPSLMENPVINSPYSGNFQTTFATLLNKEGYTSAFFHGGINGTMNFDAYAKLAGYNSYFGKNEYNNDADFDGFWGIWDEEFLLYSVKKMNEFKQPFHSSVFTLSSHHPYKIPKKHEGKFPKGHLENSESMGYADYSLKQFFDAAKKTSWYNNTLFVVCADHSSISEHPYYSNLVGLKSIPIMFFRGDNSLAGKNDSSFSQTDILPSAMNLLGYNKPFFSFGQSFLHKQNNNCYFHDNGTNFVMCDTMLFCYKGTELYSVNNLRRDSLLKTNIFKKFPALEEKNSEQFKAFIQTYAHALISNSGVAK